MTEPAPHPLVRTWETRALRLQPGLVWEMALSSLRLRFARTVLTLLTIAASTAFLTFLTTVPRAAGTDPVEDQIWGLMMVLSVLVSAAGVLNTMLMSVTQRYREIGTLKCLGALDAFVLLTVLFEAALLGLAGALLGIALGLVCAVALGTLDHGLAVLAHMRWEGWPLKLGGAALVGLGLTTFGAAVPAWIASRMPPVEAMRGEK